MHNLREYRTMDLTSVSQSNRPALPRRFRIGKVCLALLVLSALSSSMAFGQSYAPRYGNSYGGFYPTYGSGNGYVAGYAPYYGYDVVREYGYRPVFTGQPIPVTSYRPLLGGYRGTPMFSGTAPGTRPVYTFRPAPSYQATTSVGPDTYQYPSVSVGRITTPYNDTQAAYPSNTVFPSQYGVPNGAVAPATYTQPFRALRPLGAPSLESTAPVGWSTGYAPAYGYGYPTTTYRPVTGLFSAPRYYQTYYAPIPVTYYRQTAALDPNTGGMVLAPTGCAGCGTQVQRRPVLFPRIYQHFSGGSPNYAGYPGYGAGYVGMAPIQPIPAPYYVPAQPIEPSDIPTATLDSPIGSRTVIERGVPADRQPSLSPDDLGTRSSVSRYRGDDAYSDRRDDSSFTYRDEPPSDRIRSSEWREPIESRVDRDDEEYVEETPVRRLSPRRRETDATTPSRRTEVGRPLQNGATRSDPENDGEGWRRVEPGSRPRVIPRLPSEPSSMRRSSTERAPRSSEDGYGESPDRSHEPETRDQLDMGDPANEANSGASSTRIRPRFNPRRITPIPDPDRTMESSRVRIKAPPLRSDFDKSVQTETGAKVYHAVRRKIESSEEDMDRSLNASYPTSGSSRSKAKSSRTASKEEEYDDSGWRPARP